MLEIKKMYTEKKNIDSMINYGKLVIFIKKTKINTILKEVLTNFKVHLKVCMCQMF